jgi:hypothetical protein
MKETYFEERRNIRKGRQENRSMIWLPEVSSPTASLPFLYSTTDIPGNKTGGYSNEKPRLDAVFF